MTKKTIFQVILKAIGLFSLRELLESFPYVFAAFQPASFGAGFGDGFFVLFMGFGFLAFKIALIYLLLVKADRIIDILKLTDGDETVFSEWKFEVKTLLSLVIIAIGLSSLVAVLPVFVKELYIYFMKKQRSLTDLLPNDHQYPLLYPTLKLILSFLVISSHKAIGNWIMRISETKEDGVGEPPAQG